MADWRPLLLFYTVTRKNQISSPRKPASTKEIGIPRITAVT
jgi:hypothetical protein